MSHTYKIQFLGLMLLSVLLSSLTHAQSIKVNSRFHPDKVVEGQPTEYHLIIEGAIDASLSGNLPEVEGLDINANPSRNLHQEWNNGRAMATQTFAFQVVPSRKGTFTIPEWRVVLNGKSYTVPAATLNVTEQNILFLSVEIPDTPLYPGQVVNVKLHLDGSNDIRGISRNGRLGIESDSLIFEFDEDNPSRSQVSHNGESFTRYTFDGQMITTHPGSAKFSIDFPVAVTTTDSRRSSPFGMSSMFQVTRQVPFHLSTREQEVDVKPFPPGAPASFNGAVGNFTGMEVLARPQEIEAGDPITVKLRLSGEGNFSQIATPELPTTDHLLTYPPKANFTPRQSTNSKTNGTLEVEYVVRPMSNKVKAIPGIPFSFFDPKEQTYVNLSSNPIPITVKGTSIAPAAPATTGTQETPDVAPEDTLLQPLPILLETGYRFENLQPVFKSPSLLAAQAIPLAAFAYIFYAIRKRRRFQEDSIYRRLILSGKVTRQYEKAAKKAAVSKDVDTFLSNSTKAFASLMGREQEIEPASVTWHELKAWLTGKSVPQEHIIYIQSLFYTQESRQYAGDTGTADDLMQNFTPVFTATRKFTS